MMFKTMSFLDAHELMTSCQFAVEALRPLLGDMLEVVHDALNYYAQTPALWGCDEEGDYAAIFSLALSQAGYNTLLPEHDITRKLMESPSKEAE